MLAGVGLFPGASEDSRTVVADCLVEAEFPAGHRIARQGEIETGFVMIVAGSASVVGDGDVLLGDFGILATTKGDLLRAIRLSAAADRLAKAGGTGLGSPEGRMTTIFPDTCALDPADVEAAAAEGERMTVDEAVTYVLNRGKLA